MVERVESQREVFEALLSDYLETSEAVSDGDVDRQRYEWLQRFDTAAIRTAYLDVFVEALSARLKDCVKDQAAETARWIKPSDKLPEEGQEVLVLLDWRDPAQPLSEVLYTIAIFGVNAVDEGNEQRWYTDDHGALLTADVTYWRPLPLPPMEVLK